MVMPIDGLGARILPLLHLGLDCDKAFVMYIKIFPAIKNAGQSGRANLHHWCLRVMGDRGQRPNAIIGWSGGDDPMTEIALQFSDKETAVAAAKKIGLPYYVAADMNVGARKVVAKNYAENFSYLRHRPWTH